PRFGHIRECPIAVVVIKNAGAPLVRGGRAARFHSQQGTIAGARFQIDVAGNVKIEPAVTVIIEEDCATVEERAQFGSGHFRLIRDIGESPVPVIVVENIASVLGHKEIRIPVVIVIAPNAPHTVSSAGNSSFLCNVGKRPVAIVAVQRIASVNAAMVEVAAVDEIDILQAIAIKVGDADSGTENLAVDRHPFVAPVVDKLDSGGGGYICKLDRSWRRTAWLCRSGA